MLRQQQHEDHQHQHNQHTVSFCYVFQPRVHVLTQDCAGQAGLLWRGCDCTAVWLLRGRQHCSTTSTHIHTHLTLPYLCLLLVHPALHALCVELTQCEATTTTLCDSGVDLLQ